MGDFDIQHSTFDNRLLSIDNPAVLPMLSNRILSVLQLTRMALVFTAIADGWCGLLLLTRQQVGPGQVTLDQVGVSTLLLVAGISVGLYGFGMSLNDLIDRRRDAAIAAHRPLPSGRISPAAAQLLCILLLGFAVLCGAIYSQRAPIGWLSLVLVVFTSMLIVFYDLAGKYLVAPGLITLGLIRFFHSVIAAPQMPVLWHPLLLLDHVAIVSMIAYAWEEKRPAITRRQVWLVIGGVVLLNAMVIGLVFWHRREYMPAAAALRLEPGLIFPVIALLSYYVLAQLIRLRAPTIRHAGQRLIFFGLLWLIVYDAAFVAGYVSLEWAIAIAMLLPLAYLCVLMMRWWSTVVALSQRPAFKRAE